MTLLAWRPTYAEPLSGPCGRVIDIQSLPALLALTISKEPPFPMVGANSNLLQALAEIATNPQINAKSLYTGELPAPAFLSWKGEHAKKTADACRCQYSALSTMSTTASCCPLHKGRRRPSSDSELPWSSFQDDSIHRRMSPALKLELWRINTVRLLGQ